MAQWRVFILRALNKKVVRWFILLTISLIIYILCRRRPYYPPKPADYQVDDRFITFYDSYYEGDTNIKKILLWTTRFRGWGWLSEAQGVLPSCSHRCTVTNNRAELNNSHAIIFHADDLWEYKQSLFATLYNPVIPLPPHRQPNQVWVFWSVEPTCHMYGYAPGDIFNWTANYRGDSTIFTPYDMYTKKPLTNTSAPGAKQEIIVANHFREKTKMAVSVTSNCRVQSRRYRIVKELSKYIDIDEFGVCSGHVVCPQKNGQYTSSCDKYIDTYKFYLAFENSYCRDYISEKVWRSFERNQIPVVATSDSTLRLLPANSYLNVFDFPTIEALANRMIEIANNESLFNSYFQWRKHYERNNERDFCKLCRTLYQRRRRQSYNMEGWITGDTCYKPTVSVCVCVCVRVCACVRAQITHHQNYWSIYCNCS